MSRPMVIALVAVGAALVSAILTAAVFLALPGDYFLKPTPFRRSGVSAKTILLAVARNLLGVALIVLGVVLAVPGIPGQGLLTILVGLFLTDLPGKRKLELKILGIRGILNAVNRLRARFRRPPLRLP